MVALRKRERLQCFDMPFEREREAFCKGAKLVKTKESGLLLYVFPCVCESVSLDLGAQTRNMLKLAPRI